MTASRAGATIDGRRGGAACSGRASRGPAAARKIGLFVVRGVAEAQGGVAWGSVEDGRLVLHLRLPLVILSRAEGRC